MNAQFEIFPPERPHDRGGGVQMNFFSKIYMYITLCIAFVTSRFTLRRTSRLGGGGFPALLMLVSNRGGAAPPLNIFEGGLLSIHLITLTKFEGGKLSNRGGATKKSRGGICPPGPHGSAAHGSI